MKFLIDITAAPGALIPMFPEKPWTYKVPCVTGWLLDNVPDAEHILYDHLKLTPDYDGMVVVDAEEEHSSTWDGSPEWLRAKIESFQEALPRAKFGVYGIPSRLTWEWDYMDGLQIRTDTPVDIKKRIEAKMDRDFRLIHGLKNCLDFSCPSLYLMYVDQKPEYNRRNVERARSLMPNKPCVPYVSMNLEGKWIKGAVSQAAWTALIKDLLAAKVPACVLWDYYDRSAGLFGHKWFPLSTPTSSSTSGIIARVVHAVKALVGRARRSEVM